MEKNKKGSKGSRRTNSFLWTVLYMMYVVLVAPVSQQCSGPEKKPIVHEKWKKGKCTGSRFAALL